MSVDGVGLTTVHIPARSCSHSFFHILSHSCKVFKWLALLLLAIGVIFVSHLADSDSQYNGDTNSLLVRLFGGLNKIIHEISK